MGKASDRLGVKGGKIMAYCEKCNLLTEGDRCPRCGNRRLREPREDDFVFLTRRESPWAGLLEDVFSQNGIAFVVKREKGAALAIRTGPAFEGFRFYVPYCQLTQAGELMRAILDGGGFEE